MFMAAEKSIIAEQKPGGKSGLTFSEDFLQNVK